MWSAHWADHIQLAAECGLQPREKNPDQLVSTLVRRIGPGSEVSGAVPYRVFPGMDRDRNASVAGFPILRRRPIVV